MRSKYFTAKLFHLGVAKFHSPQANFVEKSTSALQMCFFLEAPPGIEPGIEVLQTFALPLGHRAVFNFFNLLKRAVGFRCRSRDLRFVGVLCTTETENAAKNTHKMKFVRISSLEFLSKSLSKPALTSFRTAKAGLDKYLSCVLVYAKCNDRFLERITGLEPATFALARRRSTK